MANAETMTAPIHETALEQLDTTVLSGKAVNISELRDYGFVVLRARPTHAGVTAALQTLGITLPTALGMTGSLDSHLVKWISPDEYLVTLPLAEKDAFVRDAKTALDGVFAAVVDNSGAYSLLKIAGTQRYDMLAKLCLYDLRGQLPVGKVVSTVLVKSPAIFYRVDEDSLLWMVRWSFADYAWKVVVHASGEFG